MRKHELTVVHAHDDKTLLYAWLLRLLAPGLRIMCTCHSHEIVRREECASLPHYLRLKLRQKVQVFLMRRHLKPVLTVADDTRTRLVRSGLCQRHVAVLHNGIDISVWRPGRGRPVLRGELGVPDDCLLVGTVARITPEKDLFTFYRVAELVAARAPRVMFVVVGDGYGEELARAREEMSRRGLDLLVRFTGHRDDLLDVYASFDLFLMTSVTEGLPNTLLEAMALGVPPVSTAVGGVPELLEHGHGGFLARVGDAEGLARHVITLLNDPHLRQECSVACRETIEKEFSFSRRVRLMEEYYAWFAGLGPLPEDAAKKGAEPRSSGILAGVAG